MDFFHYAAEKLDLPKILHRIQFYASSELGKEAIENLKPCSDLFSVSVEMDRITEMKRLLEGEDAFPIDGIKDIRLLIQRSKAENSILFPKELLSVASTLRACLNIKSYIEKRREYLKELNAVTLEITIHKQLEYNILQAIDIDGRVKDTASRVLRSIRQEIIHKKSIIQKSLERILRATAEQGMVREEIVTTRDGRMVIPIKAELKNKFPGFIHSTSSSGQTVFIEPSETLTLNNEITELYFNEQKEIDRILRELTSQVTYVADQLLTNTKILIKIDITYGKARYSIEIKGNKPFIKENGSLNIQNGYHPILLMHHRKKEIVPIEMRLGMEFSTLLISGPNAGGKTVALKSVGLLSLMVRYGIHVPVSPDSEFPLYTKIFVLIGDNQSIENDLSTYSSQILQLKIITEQADFNSLVLIDEIGSNTDPMEGGALAASVLEYLTSVGATTIATTHQSSLKVVVHNAVQMENAAMEFDQITLLPTYRFKVGLPGSSYALEIASRLGLKESIILRSKDFLGGQNNKLEKLLLELEIRSQKLSSNIQITEEELFKTKELSIIYETKLKSFQKEIKEAKRNAIDDAKKIIANANSQIEEVIQEIRSQKAEKGVIKTGKGKIVELEKEISKLESSLLRSDESTSTKLQLDLKINDVVTLKSGGQVGTVISLPDKNGNLSIGFNSITVKINISNIKSVSLNTTNKGTVTDYFSTGREASIEIDVRGQFGDDAVNQVDKFLDDATLSGVHRVDIIHGMGTGALKTKISAFLTDDKRVKTFRFGERYEGGFGVTIVELAE